MGGCGRRCPPGPLPFYEDLTVNSSPSTTPTNRVALVTGGNQGIGAGIARRLAEEGADVAFAYLAGDAEEVATHIRAAGRRALPVRVDLRDPAEIRRLMDRSEERRVGKECRS